MSAILYILEEFARRFGYAITVYRAQGGETASVIISGGKNNKYIVTITKSEDV
jgi:hypothetical protein